MSFAFELFGWSDGAKGKHGFLGGGRSGRPRYSCSDQAQRLTAEDWSGELTGVRFFPYKFVLNHREG